MPPRRHSPKTVSPSRETTGEVRLVANALSNLGAIVLAAGDADRATEVLEEAVAARPGGRRPTDPRARAQQPRRRRSDDRRLWTGRAAVRREPRAPAGARRHLEHRAVALQPRRGRPDARRFPDAGARFVESLVVEPRGRRPGGSRVVPRRARRTRRGDRRRRTGCPPPRRRAVAAQPDGRELQALRASSPRRDARTSVGTLRRHDGDGRSRRAWRCVEPRGGGRARRGPSPCAQADCSAPPRRLGPCRSRTGRPPGDAR